jgi:chromosome segregation protein
MDNGAHFYRSDFQIHSPRDPRWNEQNRNASRPVSVEERLAYALSFIMRCRAMGVGAIAITDHDDVCFAKYFQAASQMPGPTVSERDWTDWVPDPEKQNPKVFPGVEILSQVDYQVIVLLDCDAGPDLQNLLLHTVGIMPPSDDLAQAPDGQPRPFRTIDELSYRLEERQELHGRYIILPHVTPRGYRSLKTKGLKELWRTMPCVGGYIGTDWGNIHKRHQILFDGNMRGYGYNPIGIFQTTDYRGLPEDYNPSRSTWVKMARPSAESLRQACLAKESRIHQTAPEIPTRFLSRIEISNSLFSSCCGNDLL